MNAHTLRAGVIAGLLLALAGCGRKAPPAPVEGAFYPRFYPAETQADLAGPRQDWVHVQPDAVAPIPNGIGGTAGILNSGTSENR